MRSSENVIATSGRAPDCEPGTLRRLASLTGRGTMDASRETRTGLAVHPETAGSEALAWATAVDRVCIQLAAAYPGVPPPSLEEMLLTRRHYCNGDVEVTIQVYSFVAVDPLAELLASLGM